MITLDDIRQFATALPGVEEVAHFRQPGFNGRSGRSSRTLGSMDRRKFLMRGAATAGGALMPRPGDRDGVDLAAEAARVDRLT